MSLSHILVKTFKDDDKMACVPYCIATQYVHTINVLRKRKNSSENVFSKFNESKSNNAILLFVLHLHSSREAIHFSSPAQRGSHFFWGDHSGSSEGQVQSLSIHLRCLWTMARESKNQWSKNGLTEYA